MKKLFILIVISVVCSSLVNAQNNWRLKDMMTVNWQIATPLNTNYLTNTTFSGGNIEYRHFIKPNLSFGAGISWNSFEQHIPQRIYEKPDGSQALYTDFIHQVYTLPMYANLHYYLNMGENLKPYFGIGIGGQYSEQSAYYNIFVTEEKNWGFVARPEAGLLWKLGQSAGIHANVGLNYASNKNESFKIDNLKHIYYSIGAFWNLY